MRVATLRRYDVLPQKRLTSSGGSGRLRERRCARKLMEAAEHQRRDPAELKNIRKKERFP